MKMLCDCSGECEDCYISYLNCCLAGHGDDDFTPITKENAIELIEKGNLMDYQVEYLKNKFSLNNEFNMEEIKDILECIAIFDNNETLENKGRYFEIIQKDVQKVIKNQKNC